MAEGPWQFDLGELLEDIKQVTKWFELGLRLGTDHAELTKIERNRKLEGIELCKADMIDFWRKNSGNVTLRKFLSALEEIGHRNLAKQLQEKYNAGAPQIVINRPVAMQIRESEPSNDFSDDFVTMSMVDRMDEEVLEVYAEFTFDLLNLFKKQRVSVDDAIYVVACRTKSESAITSKMREAKDIQAFLQAFECTQSWYDFGVTASLAALLGGKKGKKLVKSYESKLKKHLDERKITVIDSESEVKTQRCVMKIDDIQEQFTQKKRIKFHNTVMRVLKLKQDDLILRGIKKGCVELTYLIQSTLAPKIRHTIEIGECVNELKKLRIISVSIDGEVVWSQQQAKREASQRQDLKDVQSHGEVPTKPKQLRGLLDKATRSKTNLPRQMKLRSVNLSVSDDNHKSKQPFHKVVSAACRNALSKKRYILLVTIIVLFLVILVVILAYSQNLMLF